MASESKRRNGRTNRRGTFLSARVGSVWLVCGLLAGWPVLGGENSRPAFGFEKRVLTDKYYCDGINAADIDRDGHTDVVAGPFWYQGPEFSKGVAFYPPVPLDPAASPSDSMFSFVHDFNGDDWPDILVLGRVHKHEAFWYENPRGQTGFWKKHLVFERVRGESPPLLDIDADGRPEVICHWEDRWGWIRSHPSDSAASWSFVAITEKGEWNQFYHGTGVGDINGDGRLDLILNEGWWEQPAVRSKAAPWPAHPFRFAQRGGAQIYAYDVDGDGDNDVISSLDAHGWGLAWFEQVQREGQISFIEHRIMGDRSEEARYGAAFTQPHALAVADLDGDGLTDVVTGKRVWAHGPTGDIEPSATPVLYWFQLIREDGKPATFRPHLIDDRSGLGVQITVTDVNGDGAPDVLSASKLGSFVFLNRGAVARR